MKAYLSFASDRSFPSAEEENVQPARRLALPGARRALPPTHATAIVHPRAIRVRQEGPRSAVVLPARRGLEGLYSVSSVHHVFNFFHLFTDKPPSPLSFPHQTQDPNVRESDRKSPTHQRRGSAGARLDAAHRRILLLYVFVVREQDIFFSRVAYVTLSFLKILQRDISNSFVLSFSALCMCYTPSRPFRHRTPPPTFPTHAAASPRPALRSFFRVLVMYRDFVCLAWFYGINDETDKTSHLLRAYVWLRDLGAPFVLHNVWLRRRER